MKDYIMWSIYWRTDSHVMASWTFSLSYKAIRFNVLVHLLSDWSRKSSKCVRNIRNVLLSSHVTLFCSTAFWPHLRSITTWTRTATLNLNTSSVPCEVLILLNSLEKNITHKYSKWRLFYSVGNEAQIIIKRANLYAYITNGYPLSWEVMTS